MKNKIVLLGLLVIAVVLVSGCTQNNSLTVTSPTEGQEIAGPDVTVKLSTNLKVVAPSDKNVQGEGHFHLYVDDGAYIPVAADSYTIKGLVAAGEHKVKVELHANDHSLLGVERTVRFKVKASQMPLAESSGGTLLDTISGDGTKSAPKNVATPPSLPTGKFIGK